jgi:hypothetical protein
VCSFQADIKILSLMRIHKALQTSATKQRLSDYVDEEKLRDCARNCLDRHGMSYEGGV